MKAIGILVLASLVMTGCAKSEVTNSDIDGLAKTYSNDSYEDAMRKAGRGAELEEQKRMAAERGQGGGR